LRCAKCYTLLGDVPSTRNRYNVVIAILKGGQICQENYNYMKQATEGLKDLSSLETMIMEANWCLEVSDANGALTHTNSALTLAPFSRTLQIQKVTILLILKYVYTCLNILLESTLNFAIS